ncbi:MAG: hypothetical protein ACI32F_08890, partial [Allobaculum sp.]
DGKRKNCSLCRQKNYTLKGKDGKRAYLYGNPDCNMQIFDEKPINRMDEIDLFKEEGINAFRIVLSVENKTESQKIREEFREKISG